jgi:hypothetical protein
MFIGVGRSENLPTWNDFPIHFGVIPADDVNDTETFLYGADEPDKLFPLDR